MSNTPNTSGVRFRIVQAGMWAGGTALLGMMLGCGAGTPAGPSLPVTPAFSVSGVSPSIASIAGNSRVSIYGTGFASGATVTFDGVAATGVTFVGGRVLRAITPGTAVAKKVDVVVTNPDGQRGVGTASLAPPDVDEVCVCEQQRGLTSR